MSGGNRGCFAAAIEPRGLPFSPSNPRRSRGNMASGHDQFFHIRSAASVTAKYFDLENSLDYVLVGFTKVTIDVQLALKFPLLCLFTPLTLILEQASTIPSILTLLFCSLLRWAISWNTFTRGRSNESGRPFGQKTLCFLFLSFFGNDKICRCIHFSGVGGGGRKFRRTKILLENKDGGGRGCQKRLTSKPLLGW